jgi:hypothetical protein
MLISQISWVIKLVIKQQVLMTQISLVIKLVLTQQALDSNFFGNQAGSNATDAGQSNFR